MSEEEEDFAAMFEASVKARRFERGQTIEGTIVAFGPEVAFVSVGGKSLRAIARGMGEVIEVEGQPAAVYRGLDSKISVRSAVCTHMGCYVHWNDAERTWDCPCHGSRFKTNGDVMAGPAEDPLAPIAKTHTGTHINKA